jgi:hypothetical protein
MDFIIENMVKNRREQEEYSGNKKIHNKNPLWKFKEDNRY